MGLPKMACWVRFGNFPRFQKGGYRVTGNPWPETYKFRCASRELGSRKRDPPIDLALDPNGIQLRQQRRKTLHMRALCLDVCWIVWLVSCFPLNNHPRLVKAFAVLPCVHL